MGRSVRLLVRETRSLDLPRGTTWLLKKERGLPGILVGRPPPGRGAETCRSSAWVEKLLFGCLRLLARPGAGPGRVGLLAALGMLISWAEIALVGKLMPWENGFLGGTWEPGGNSVFLGGRRGLLRSLAVGVAARGGRIAPPALGWATRFFGDGALGSRELGGRAGFGKRHARFRDRVAVLGGGLRAQSERG